MVIVNLLVNLAVFFNLGHSKKLFLHYITSSTNVWCGQRDCVIEVTAFQYSVPQYAHSPESPQYSA